MRVYVYVPPNMDTRDQTNGQILLKYFLYLKYPDNVFFFENKLYDKNYSKMQCHCMSLRINKWVES